MWKEIDISNNELAAWTAEFGKRARFLVDENMDPELATILRELKYNSISVADAGLTGLPDEAILAFAKREDRILITSDDDFENERRFPEHRNPGVVIIPDGRLDDTGVQKALASMLPVVGHYRPLFNGAIVRVDRAGILSVTAREHDTGARKTTRYKHSKHGSYIWDDGSE